MREVVREALRNVGKHARALNAIVFASADEGQLELCVEDDGVGFDPAAPQSQAEHFGLAGLGKLVKEAGGELSVESEPGQGCTVRARFAMGDKPW